ncbi:MAG TPA: hypothetical protein VIH96_18085, partial [Paraburkholderia sp.]
KRTLRIDRKRTSSMASKRGRAAGPDYDHATSCSGLIPLLCRASPRAEKSRCTSKTCEKAQGLASRRGHSLGVRQQDLPPLDASHCAGTVATYSNEAQ